MLWYHHQRQIPLLVKDSIGRFLLPSGETTVEVFADDDILVQWDSVTDSGQEAMPKSAAVRIANSWTKTFNLSEVGLVEIVTDVDAHLIISHGNSGKTSLLGEEGNYLFKALHSTFKNRKSIIF